MHPTGEVVLNSGGYTHSVRTRASACRPHCLVPHASCASRSRRALRAAHRQTATQKSINGALGAFGLKLVVSPADPTVWSVSDGARFLRRFEDGMVVPPLGAPGPARALALAAAHGDAEAAAAAGFGGGRGGGWGGGPGRGGGGGRGFGGRGRGRGRGGNPPRWVGGRVLE